MLNGELGDLFDIIGLEKPLFGQTLL